LIDFELKMS